MIFPNRKGVIPISLSPFRYSLMPFKETACFHVHRDAPSLRNNAGITRDSPTLPKRDQSVIWRPPSINRALLPSFLFVTPLVFFSVFIFSRTGSLLRSSALNAQRVGSMMGLKDETERSIYEKRASDRLIGTKLSINHPDILPNAPIYHGNN
ncbi:hypothetical protein F5Y04DRAFT_62028 [Hypomontagnella monticulosa]|nr:hypothetical protein F5Y04DRAFT_62028 [Hypomontagnella monticulosa]